MRPLLWFTLWAGCNAEGGAQVAMNLQLAFPDTQGSFSTASLATANGPGLKSLKYAISEIGICEGGSNGATGFSAGAGCIALYKAPPDPFYDSMNGRLPTAEDYQAAWKHAHETDSGYIDLVDPAQRKKLSTPVTLFARDARSYSYGYIYWRLPVKVTAELTPTGGDTPTLFTHDGPLQTAPDYSLRSSTALTSGPAGEAVVIFDNGGTWFKFQSPFVVSAADIAAGTYYVLDLTFNADGLLNGHLAGDLGSAFDRIKDSDGNAISLPYLDLSPVPHKRCERAMKETYIGTTQHNGDAFDFRVELYYLENDPQKSVYGVETAALANGGSLQFHSMPKTSFIESNADGSLNLQDWGRHAFISGLVRRDQVGDTTAALLGCGAFEQCSAGPTTPVMLTLVAVRPLEAGASCDCVTSSDCHLASQVCVAGVCTACGGSGSDGKSCQAGGTCCGSRCVDTAADATNCGACGTSCAAGNSCAGGRCGCGSDSRSCASGTSACSACRTSCGAGGCTCSKSSDCGDPNDVCVSGVCVTCNSASVNQLCASGLTCCGTRCVDLANDRQNCGACGVSADFGTDPNCGACGRNCAQQGLACGYSVTAGFACLFRGGSGCALDSQCASGMCRRDQDGYSRCR